MDAFREDLGFDAEDWFADPYLLQSFDVPAVFNATYQQRLVGAGGNFPPLMTNLDETMDFVEAEQPTVSTSQIPVQIPLSQNHGDRFPVEFHHDATLQSFQRPDTVPQPQFIPSTCGLPPSQDNPIQRTLRKRAPKAVTLSAKEWEPYESRIRQLYVHDRLSVEELRKTINKEFGLGATTRQYIVHLRRLNIERNVKEDERKAIVKHIQHRAHAGKNSKTVRIRGHKKSEEMLSRWIKEENIRHPYTPAHSPSTLPDCVSIYTSSSSRSYNNVSPDPPINLQPTTDSGASKDVLQRVFRYAQAPQVSIDTREARYLLNDLQSILTSQYCPCSTSSTPFAEQDIVKLRNLINLTQQIDVDMGRKEEHKPSSSLNQNLEVVRRSRRCISRSTSYGRIDVSLWNVFKQSLSRAVRSDDEPTEADMAATVTITPGTIEKSSFRIVFDFTPQHDPLAKITYQTVIPNSSEIFSIIQSGDVTRLIRALQNGNASLTVRDEQGRSLLNYALHYRNVDMCEFLVVQKLDVNSLEPYLWGPIGPVYDSGNFLHAEEPIYGIQKNAQCYELLLKAGADLSLENDNNDGLSSWYEHLYSSSYETCKFIVDFGEPFINPKARYKEDNGEDTFPLLWLASYCGYATDEIIEIVDKAICLLNRNADISCRDRYGNTILHTIFKCDRRDAVGRQSGVIAYGWRCLYSTEAPKDLLMVSITAGADVYAKNNLGETPSMIAADYGHEDEWIETLELCGIDSEEVITHSESHSDKCTLKHQVSKLSFKEYCRTRRYDWRYEQRLRFKENEKIERYRSRFRRTESDNEEDCEDGCSGHHACVANSENSDDSVGKENFSGDGACERGSESEDDINRDDHWTECVDGSASNYSMSPGAQEVGNLYNGQYIGEIGNVATERGSMRETDVDIAEIECNEDSVDGLDMNNIEFPVDFDFDSYLHEF